MHFEPVLDEGIFWFCVGKIQCRPMVIIEIFSSECR